MKRLVAALCALLMMIACLPAAAFAQPAQVDAAAQEPAAAQLAQDAASGADAGLVAQEPAAAQLAQDAASGADAGLVAQDINVIQGHMGNNCSWRLEPTGRLVIEPADRSKPCEMGNIRYQFHANVVAGNPESTAPWYPYRDKVVTAYVASGVKGSEQMTGLFYDCKNLTSADLTNLDTSNVRYAGGMFDGCTSLVRYLMPNLNFTKVTNMEFMFYGCTALESVDLRYIDTSNVINMARMFYGCTSLTSINMSGFKTKSVMSMYEMFRDCSSLKSIDVSSFDTSKVDDMSRMFYGCEKLTSLDLSRFSTTALKERGTMSNMFYGCKSLDSIDISGFTVSENTDRNYMFNGCPNLERVSVGSGWTFKGTGGKGVTLPTGDWISSATDQTLSASQIAETRNNVADTYVKANPSVIGPFIETGQNLVWARGSFGGAVFKSSAELNGFVCVKVDGAIIDRINYDLTAGSTIVTLKPDYLETLSDGNHSIDIVSSTGTATASFRISSDPNAATVLGPVSMYRLYNPNSGEHHYTADANERDTLDDLGWDYEGVGWVAPAAGDEVYRLYNANGGEHHYTLDANERQVLMDAGWTDEGIGWHSGGSVELHRQYNPNQFANNHNYTQDLNEKTTLIGLGWHDEGIAWYGVQ